MTKQDSILAERGGTLPAAIRGYTVSATNLVFDAPSSLTDPRLAPPGASVPTVRLSLSLFLESAYSDVSEPHRQGLHSNWADFIDQVAFLINYFPVHNLATLADVILRYTYASDFLLIGPNGTGLELPKNHVTRVRVEIRWLTEDTSPSEATEAQDERAGAGIVSRQVESLELPHLTHEKSDWGRIDIVIETPEPSAGLYILRIAPHQSIPLHIHRVMRERELVISHGLMSQNKAVPYGSVMHWGDLPHTYHNPTEHFQSVLCIDTPSFLPDDEILVDGQPGGDVKFEMAGGKLWKTLTEPLGNSTAVAAPPSFTFYDEVYRHAIELILDPRRFAPATGAWVCGFDCDGNVVLVSPDSEGWELPFFSFEPTRRDEEIDHQLRGILGSPVYLQTPRVFAQHRIEASPSGGAGGDHGPRPCTFHDIVFVTLDAPAVASGAGAHIRRAPVSAANEMISKSGNRNLHTLALRLAWAIFKRICQEPSIATVI